MRSHIETSSRNEVKLLHAIGSSGQGIATEKQQEARDGCLRGTGKRVMEMVPANQSVAAAHTPQSAEGTPIVDTSTSSDSAMGDIRGNVNLAQFNQLNQQVRIEKAQILQQQQNVVNLTADPMILAEAQRVVAEVQQEARQSRDQVISEAREFVQSSQELASIQARAQVQASREEISNEASEYAQAITRDFQSQLEVARQYGVQARGQLQDLSARFHQVELERNQAIETLRIPRVVLSIK